MLLESGASLWYLYALCCNYLAQPVDTGQAECDSSITTGHQFTLYLAGRGGLNASVLTVVVGAETFVRNVVPADGKWGNKNGSAQFVDEDSFIYITPSDVVNPQCGFTITAWVFVRSDEVIGPIAEFLPINNMRGFHVFIYEGRLLANFNLSDLLESPVGSVQENAWIHVAVTVNLKNKKVKLWMNGHADREKNFHNVAWHYGGLRIGGRGGDGEDGEDRALRARIFCLEFHNYAVTSLGEIIKIRDRCNKSSTQDIVQGKINVETTHPNLDASTQATNPDDASMQQPKGSAKSTSDACGAAIVDMAAACEMSPTTTTRKSPQWWQKSVRRFLAAIEPGRHRRRTAKTLRRAAWDEEPVDGSIFSRESLTNLLCVDRSMIRTALISCAIFGALFVVYTIRCGVGTFLRRRRRLAARASARMRAAEGDTLVRSLEADHSLHFGSESSELHLISRRNVMDMLEHQRDRLVAQNE